MDSKRVPPGSYLKVLLKMKKGMTVIFSVNKHDGTNQHVGLGKSVFDMVQPDSPKNYLIDTKMFQMDIINRTIQLVFDFYSGAADIQVGFD